MRTNRNAEVSRCRNEAAAAMRTPDTGLTVPGAAVHVSLWDIVRRPPQRVGSGTDAASDQALIVAFTCSPHGPFSPWPLTHRSQ